ncbi:MAG TPA: DEAD/DEAH box helicase [Agitococcus sp.]|nr:DEAD/DEAH box helicase [Bacteroidia bacterium]HNJ85874.1 DEAD/DEAH box helicase [Agitococcus sp.]
MPSRNDLHPYQHRMIDFIYNTPKCAVWAGLGLGKTVTTLTAITDLLDSFSVSKVLIIAPLRVANSVWHTESKRWTHTKDLTFSIVTGSEKERISALFKSADIYVINRENVQWLVEHYKTKWPYDLVVIDESSSFKSASSQRFKALKKVRTLTDRMVQLTGTPSPNGLIDVWSQMFLLDGGERLGKTMSAYKMRFFEAGYNGYSFKPVKNADKIIHKLIDDIVISLNVDDYLEMPERIDTVMRVNIPPARLAEYKQLERDFIMQINDTEIVAYNAATLAGKLLQYCNGAMYTDELKNWTEIHTAKLDALDEILEDNQDENLLIAYNYKTDLIRLKARYPDAVVLDNDPDIITRWNNGQIKILLAHPASAGHGLNLQHGGSIIVWFGLNWSLELYQQFNGRLHRQGQTKPVRIVHIVADGCIDDKVMRAIENKAQTQDELLNALKLT